MRMNDFLCNNRMRPEEVLCSRRQFLARCGMGLGALGLASLLSEDAIAAATGSGVKLTHFPAKAKHVIHIFAQGAPSHIDTWDPKPALAKYEDQTLLDMNGVAMPSPFKFTKRGKSGIEVSEVFDALGNHVDDMAIIRSMHTDIPAHDVATVFMNTGSLRMAKPSLGAWALYGLGSENENMPGYISLRPGGSPPGRALNWGSAFLPGNFQATSINTKAAYRMQMEATDAFDIAKEPQNIRDLYGSTPQGRQLLIARRLIERGVRFVQVWAGGWDHHQDIEDRLKQSASEIDKPAAALLTDLKQRGLFNSTLVVWGGEFGRTVTRDRNGNDNPGRDHNNRAFSVWLAGGGVKGGTIYGATDEFGARAVENKVHVHDLHATILRLLGFDHEKLTYRYNGRDFRLTDNFGQVVKGVMA